MSEPVRVLFVHFGEGRGGASRCLIELLRALPSRYEATVLTSGPGLRQMLQAARARVVVEPRLSTWQVGVGWPRVWQLHRWLPGAFRFPGAVWATWRAIRGLRPDLVHLNSSSLLPEALGARMARARVIWHIREPVQKGHLGLRRALVRRAIAACADGVVAITEHDRDLLGRRVAAKARVVYDWLDESARHVLEPRDTLRRRLGVPEDAPLAVYLGGGSRIKGIEVLVPAIEIVLQALPAARFVLTGCEEYFGRGLRKALRRAWPELSSVLDTRRLLDRYPEVAAATTVLGFVDDTASLLAAGDLLLFPSTVPHAGKPISEAAAQGRPAVASDFGELREVIEHEVTGLLVRPNDPTALAEAIVNLMRDRERAETMGRAAREQLTRTFSQEQNLAVLLSVYEDVLESGPGSSRQGGQR